MTERIGLSPLDVVSVEKELCPLYAATFQVSEMALFLANNLKNFSVDTKTDWAWRGVPCEVLLRDGRGWQTGRVRFSLEFIPDAEDKEEEELILTATPIESVRQLAPSPLDDLRAELLNNESST